MPSGAVPKPRLFDMKLPVLACLFSRRPSLLLTDYFPWFCSILQIKYKTLASQEKDWKICNLLVKWPVLDILMMLLLDELLLSTSSSQHHFWSLVPAFLSRIVILMLLSGPFALFTAGIRPWLGMLRHLRVGWIRLQQRLLLLHLGSLRPSGPSARWRMLPHHVLLLRRGLDMHVTLAWVRLAYPHKLFWRRLRVTHINRLINHIWLAPIFVVPLKCLWLHVRLHLIIRCEINLHLMLSLSF